MTDKAPRIVFNDTQLEKEFAISSRATKNAYLRMGAQGIEAIWTEEERYDDKLVLTDRLCFG